MAKPAAPLQVLLGVNVHLRQTLPAVIARLLLRNLQTPGFLAATATTPSPAEHGRRQRLPLMPRLATEALHAFGLRRQLRQANTAPRRADLLQVSRQRAHPLVIPTLATPTSIQCRRPRQLEGVALNAAERIALVAGLKPRRQAFPPAFCGNVEQPLQTLQAPGMAMRTQRARATHHRLRPRPLPAMATAATELVITT